MEPSNILQNTNVCSNEKTFDKMAQLRQVNNEKAFARQSHVLFHSENVWPGDFPISANA